MAEQKSTISKKSLESQCRLDECPHFALYVVHTKYTLFKPFCCNGPLYVFTLFLQTLIQYELRYDL